MLLTYEEWPRGQTEERQIEALGPERHALWKDGRLSVRDMIDADGSPISVAELERVYGGAESAPEEPPARDERGFSVSKAEFEGWFDPMKELYHELYDRYKDEYTDRDELLNAIRKNMPNTKADFLAISNLPPHIQSALETKADILYFSPDGVAKQLFNHPEITSADYRGIINKLQDCEEIYRSKDFRVVLIVQSGRHYAAVMKTSRDRSEAYLISMYELRPKDLVRMRKGDLIK